VPRSARLEECSIAAQSIKMLATIQHIDKIRYNQNLDKECTNRIFAFCSKHHLVRYTNHADKYKEIANDSNYVASCKPTSSPEWDLEYFDRLIFVAQGVHIHFKPMKE
jgi:hypothetical protein